MVEGVFPCVPVPASVRSSSAVVSCGRWTTIAASTSRAARIVPNEFRFQLSRQGPRRFRRHRRGLINELCETAREYARERATTSWARFRWSMTVDDEPQAGPLHGRIAPCGRPAAVAAADVDPARPANGWHSATGSSPSVACPTARSPWPTPTSAARTPRSAPRQRLCDRRPRSTNGTKVNGTRIDGEQTLATATSSASVARTCASRRADCAAATEPLLSILKFALLALLYLFFARVLWAVWSEVRGTSRPVRSAQPLGAADPTVAAPSPLGAAQAVQAGDRHRRAAAVTSAGSSCSSRRRRGPAYAWARRSPSAVPRPAPSECPTTRSCRNCTPGLFGRRAHDARGPRLAPTARTSTERG